MLQTEDRVYWTSADLEFFPDNGNRYEIIDGELIVTRAPNWQHQKVAGKIYAELLHWSMRTGLGETVFAPGIIFADADNVIPDVVWASNKILEEYLDEKGHLTAAPELIVEVLSQSKADQERDLEKKLKLYSVQGVREYWVCNYEAKKIMVFRRDRAVLKLACTLFLEDVLTSPLLPDFQCLVEKIFA